MRSQGCCWIKGSPGPGGTRITTISMIHELWGDSHTAFRKSDNRSHVNSDG